MESTRKIKGLSTEAADGSNEKRSEWRGSVTLWGKRKGEKYICKFDIKRMWDLVGVSRTGGSDFSGRP